MRWDRVRAHLTGRGEWWWAPILYTLAVVWIYRGMWQEYGHPTALGWDTQDSYGPDLQFLARDFHEGRFTLWNPYDHGGYSLVADVGFPRWYPVHWLFAGWGALLGADWWLIQVEVLAHHVIAGCTMHLFLRSRGLGRGAAFIGGMTVIASAAFLQHKASILLWPIAWAPLVLIAFDRLAREPSWRTGAWLGAAITLVGVAGSPPSFLYVMMFVGPYGLLRVVQAVLDARRRGDARRTALRLAAALATALGLVVCALAVVLVPTFELIPLAQRGDMKGREFALNAPLTMVATFGAMVAPSRGNMSASVGVIALALAACALVVRPRGDRGVAIVFWLVGLFALMLAFGEKGKLLPWFIDHVPPFNLFRAPARYRLITTLGLAACAGYGAHTLASAPRAWQRDRWRALGVAAAILALSFYAITEVAAQTPMPVPPGPRSDTWSSLFALAAAALIALLVMLPGRWRALPLALAPLLIVNEAPFFLHTPSAPPAAEARHTHDGDDAVLARLGDVSVAYRLHDEFVLGERVGPRRRVRDFRGYPAIDPLSQMRYLDVLMRARKSPEILEAFNVRWVLHAPHFRDGSNACFVQESQLGSAHFIARGDGIWETRHPAPLAAWYGAVRIADSPAHALDSVLAAEGPDGQRQYATLEAPDALELSAEALRTMSARALPGVAATVDSYQPDAIDLSIDAPEAGLVVLNEVWYPGWEVTVDGDPRPALRADYLLRGVMVPAGHHTIGWRFRPTLFRALFLLYLLAVVSLFASLVPVRYLHRPVIKDPPA
jgi:hypothetical protein